MKTLAFFGLALSATLLLGQATANEPQTESQNITQLVFRDQIILISTGDDGLQYSLHQPDGTILARHLTDQQLAAQYPDIHNHVRTLIAGPQTDDDVMIWGGL